jgi:BolA protein
MRLGGLLAPTPSSKCWTKAPPCGPCGADGTGSGTHFRVRIASPLFTGKTRVAQHRLVYDALQLFIDRGVHALAIELHSLTLLRKSP